MMRQPLNGPSVWLGRDMAQSRRWIKDFPSGALAEIDEALRWARRNHATWDSLDTHDFPLTVTRAFMAEVAVELEDGCGMMKLRGLPAERYSEEDLRFIWFGLGRCLGIPVFQNCRGELMRAIRDEGAEVGKRYGQVDTGGDKPFLSSYARTLSNGALRFHTDRCDVVGLLCVRQAARGGLSRLCSSPAVHNAMLERCPDLLEALFAPCWRSRFGEEANGARYPYPLPVFGIRDDRFTSHFSLTYIEAAQLLPDVPRLAPSQRDAINMLLELAGELAFDMSLEPGDIQFLNNHVIYHGRTPFEDDAASGHDRLLLRLWLSMPNSRALPHDHEILWGDVRAGARRGGIGQDAVAAPA